MSTRVESRRDEPSGIWAIGSTTASYKTSTNKKNTPQQYVHKAQLKTQLQPPVRRLFYQNHSESTAYGALSYAD